MSLCLFLFERIKVEIKSVCHIVDAAQIPNSPEIFYLPPIRRLFCRNKKTGHNGPHLDSYWSIDVLELLKSLHLFVAVNLSRASKMNSINAKHFGKHTFPHD